MGFGLIVIVFLLGMSAGCLFSDLLRAQGTLRIDHSNPEKDVYLFEIDSLDDVNNKKRIVLKIDHNADLSQK